MSQRLDGHVDSSGECADIRVQLGIYVFGAITPADRAPVVRHLATCPNCRDELVGLAALPGLLLRPPAVAAAYSSGHLAAAPEQDLRPALVNRTLGTITRPGGSAQATYDGHPLYTASLDTAPGQAKGNGLYSGGGIWHEVTVSGATPPASSPSASHSEGGEGY